ncbi:MAG: biotin/lipoyl-binding protein [Acidimicrobiaceae bacterium]|nr:biotin/lipoyl-binding protein [Acidimicrobiaceae bacterium]
MTQIDDSGEYLPTSGGAAGNVEVLSPRSSGGRSRLSRIGRGISSHRIISGLVILALIGGALYGYYRTRPKSTAALVAEPVSLATIRQEISITGTIEPQTDLGLLFGTTGTVSTINVVSGQKVKAGTVLATLNTTTLTDQIAQAETTLSAAKASLASAEGALPLTEQSNNDSLSQTQLAVQQDSAKLATDQSTLTLDQAIANNWCQADASSSECVSAQQAYTSAQATVQADQQNLSIDQESVTATQTKNTQSVDSANAAIAQDQTSYNNAVASLGAAETAYTDCTSASSSSSGSSGSTGSSATSCTQESQAVTSAQGQVSSAATSLSNAQTALTDTEAQNAVSLAQAQLAVTDATQKLATDQTTLNLDQAIASGGCSADPSSSECNQAQSAVTSQTQAVSSDQFQLATAQSQLPSTQVKNTQSIQQSQSSISADEAQVANDQAALATDQASLSQAEIVAPISGVVDQINVTVGQSGSVSSSASSSSSGPSGAIILSSPGSYEVQGSVSDAQIAQIQLGEQATIVPAGSTTAIYGTVTQITPQATITSGVASYPIVVSITDANPNLYSGVKVTSKAPPLFAGASAQVALIVKQATNVLSVPTSAVHTVGSLSYVLVKNKTKETRVTIAVGAADAQDTQVLSGLKLGQEVVLANRALAIPSSTAGFAGGFGAGGFGGGGGLGRGGGLARKAGLGG